MKKQLIASAIIAGLALAPAALANGAANITLGHWDIAAVFEDSELELELGSHEGGGHVHYELGGATINYNFTTIAKSNVTVGASNLGQLWVTPHSEAEADEMGMPFIGFGAEELDAPFTGPVTFTMTGFNYTGSGAGHFFLFEDDDLFWNSTAGLGNYGSFSVAVGQHGHGEFAFSDAGTYLVTLTASANNGSLITSAPASFTFEVVPEPSTYALLALGAGALAFLRWRRRPQA
jgi:surface-anchored protein